MLGRFFTIGLWAALLSLPGGANATVVPNDTFSFVLLGGTPDNQTFVLGGPHLATFGSTQTYVGAGPNGQDYTFSSRQEVGPARTTLIFELTTPQAFITTPQFQGQTISIVSLNVGTPASGVGLPGGRDSIDTIRPLGLVNTRFDYGYDGTIFGTTGTFDHKTKRFSYFQLVNFGGEAASERNVNLLRYSANFANSVPEPSSWAMMIVGFGAIGGMARRRPRGAGQAVEAGGGAPDARLARV